MRPIVTLVLALFLSALFSSGLSADNEEKRKLLHPESDAPFRISRCGGASDYQSCVEQLNAEVELESAWRKTILCPDKSGKATARCLNRPLSSSEQNNFTTWRSERLKKRSDKTAK